MPDRLEQLKRWLDNELEFSDYTLAPASSDASFRRYFRVVHDGARFIIMDAPPEKEDSRPFIRVAKQLFDAGLNVPEVLDEDLDQGFLLLSDLGNTPYLGALNEASVERLYGDALGALAAIQTCACDGLPRYDRALLLREMELFREWLVEKHLGITPGDAQHALLDDAFDLLIENALAQPQVFVHRDYHSRNLMLIPRNNPGILDFQDAVYGPVTYDLVSLLRDCYIAWPRSRVEDWALGYLELALQTGILHEEHNDPVQFLRWFDLMGVQRHLKASGIFARLNHRDGKPGYLDDIPRTLGVHHRPGGTPSGTGAAVRLRRKRSAGAAAAIRITGWPPHAGYEGGEDGYPGDTQVGRERYQGAAARVRRAACLDVRYRYDKLATSATRRSSASSRNRAGSPAVTGIWMSYIYKPNDGKAWWVVPKFRNSLEHYKVNVQEKAYSSQHHRLQKKQENMPRSLIPKSF